MRLFICATLIALFAAPVIPVDGQIANDYLIVPGYRVGPIKLFSSSLGEVERIFGLAVRRDVIQQLPSSVNVNCHKTVAYGWADADAQSVGRLGFEVIFYEDDLADCPSHVAWINVYSPRYHTTRGVHVLSPIADALKEFGSNYQAKTDDPAHGVTRYFYTYDFANRRYVAPNIVFDVNTRGCPNRSGNSKSKEQHPAW